MNSILIPNINSKTSGILVREYQPLIPQFLTIQLNYYFLITGVTFDHLSIQTAKTNKCTTDFASIL